MLVFIKTANLLGKNERIFKMRHFFDGYGNTNSTSIESKKAGSSNDVEANVNVKNIAESNNIKTTVVENSLLTEEESFFDGYPTGQISRESIIPRQNSSTANVEGRTEAESFGKSDNDINVYLEELNQLIGLERVKNEIHRLINYVKIKNLRIERGITNSSMMLHSVFYGNPGTGKTTIARLYGKMLASLGLLSKGHIVETDRSGLIAKYIGQTAVKTDKKINEALGGVLFIDEAYSLVKGEHAEWDYGQEALEVLIKRMEDHRDDLVVIVAGYPKPMKKFLESNEGLQSRFSTYIQFDDYLPGELLEIFQLFCKKENYEIGDLAIDLVLGAIEYKYNNRDEKFGNARFIRNFFEAVTRNQAMRLGMSVDNPSLKQLKEILPDDIPFLIDGANL